MLSAILMIALAQTPYARAVEIESLDPVPPCQTCDALTARVASLEAQLAARTAAQPVRRVRLIPVSEPVPSASCYTTQAVPASCYATQAVPVATYSAPTVTYASPLGTALPTLSAWAPGAIYTSSAYVERRGLFGGRLFGSRFAAASVCGPGGCP